MELQSFRTIKEYILSDYYRNYAKRVPFLKCCISALFRGGNGYTYMFWFRLCKLNSWVRYIAAVMHHHYSIKYQIQIPRTVEIGYGFLIMHNQSIVMNSRTKIGDNCTIHPFLNIGSNYRTPAIIGNNVWIGPNVSIVEQCHIGANATIGAGAVIIKDVPNDATVAGVPAKVISYKEPARFIANIYKKNEQK